MMHQSNVCAIDLKWSSGGAIQTDMAETPCHFAEASLQPPREGPKAEAPAQPPRLSRMKVMQLRDHLGRNVTVPACGDLLHFDLMLRDLRLLASTLGPTLAEGVCVFHTSGMLWVRGCWYPQTQLCIHAYIYVYVVVCMCGVYGCQGRRIQGLLLMHSCIAHSQSESRPGPFNPPRAC
jgi:hypothetical protein